MLIVTWNNGLIADLHEARFSEEEKERRVGDRGRKNGFLTQHIRGAFFLYSVGLQIFAVLTG